MPEIIIPVTEKAYASIEKEAERTGWSVVGLVSRWLEFGMLNSGKALPAKEVAESNKTET